MVLKIIKTNNQHTKTAHKHWKSCILRLTFKYVNYLQADNQRAVRNCNYKHFIANIAYGVSHGVFVGEIHESKNDFVFLC